MYTWADVTGKAIYNVTALESLDLSTSDSVRRLTCTYDQGATPGNCWVGDGTSTLLGDRVAVIVTDSSGSGAAGYRLAILTADGELVGGASLAGPAYEPAWSPGGDTLLVTRHALPRNHSGVDAGRLTRISTDGRELGTVGPPGARSADWAATGEIAYSYGGQIWTTRPDGEPRQLTTAGGVEPSWSPDGEQIAFERGTTVWTMQRDGSQQAQLLEMPSRAPAWSPDGRFIAFTDDGDLWLTAADGACPRRLRRGDGFYVSHDDPFWRPHASAEQTADAPAACEHLRPDLTPAARVIRVGGPTFPYRYRAHPGTSGRAVFRIRGGRRVLARASFTAGPRGAVRLRVKLSRAARRALRGKRTLRLTAVVTVTDRNGSRLVSATARKGLTLRSPKR
jgi:dipeptidyl aminopeptidase/acylaminoacyl peptidase